MVGVSQESAGSTSALLSLATNRDLSISTLRRYIRTRRACL